MKESNLTFNEFCVKYLDRLYTPGIPDKDQSTGYKNLKRMVVENIVPASEIEFIRWRDFPLVDELKQQPNIKYLTWCHPLLRITIRENWDIIKTLDIYLEEINF